MIEFLISNFVKNLNREAIVWKDRSYTYGWLLQRIEHWREMIKSHDIGHGAVAILEADFSPDAVALYLALIEHECILVPLTKSVEAKKSEFIAIAQGEVSFVIDNNDNVEISRINTVAAHPLYEKLRKLQHPGLVLFSSGSTGKSKAAVHDHLKLLDKFKVSRHCIKTVTFLLYDHIGGVNTMFYILSNAGCIVTVLDRSPDAVLSLIEKYKVELLPTSPTFINLIILSECYRKYDLSSLKLITYGTEPMPESTLKRINDILPHVQLQQTYGLSELGIMRSKSKDSGSLWVKLGGEGFETKIVDGILWIRSSSAMLGYLNAPNPFDEDGWFNTEDNVEVDGEYFRILGRKSELINVGGQKVYPVEVEGVLQTMEGVEDVTVRAEPNSIMGQIVKASIKLSTDETAREFRKRMREFLSDKLPDFKIPQKVVIVSSMMHGERFKKMRRNDWQ